MREIKFRAWGKIDKKMHTPGKLNVLLSNLDPLKVPMWWNSDGDEVVWMQFTGLHDKNGKEIYEGDILKYTGSNCAWCGQHLLIPNHPFYKVEFNKEQLEFQANSVDKELDNFMSPSIWGTDMEVIGNIFESPELLEESHEPKI